MRFLAGVLLTLTLLGCGDPSGMRTEGDFVRREGAELVVGADATPLRLRGVCFGNWAWWTDEIAREHHGAVDYARVRDMGMNLVRYYLNYRILEDDDQPTVYKEDGWQWLDQNIAWARENEIYLVLNMHIPPGGYQPLGDGLALWTDARNQDRLVALWRAIALRYKDEPTVAGYDLLNEPVPPESAQQWQALANRIITEIRRVDQDHMIVIDKNFRLHGDWQSFQDHASNQILVNDPNVLYQFHFYYPTAFTIPYLSPNPLGEYPVPGAYDQAYLEAELLDLLQFGREHDVPMFVGEFGLDHSRLNAESGGLLWVRHMLELLNKYDLDYAYHEYHADPHGIYAGRSGIPREEASQPELISLFREFHLD